MAIPLDLDQLRSFVAIVDTGSFTRAADEVFKTQSAVSMQMRKLEERLGVTLFERNGRAVRITEEGNRLLSYARKILALSQETLSAFDEDAIQGHVRIGLPDDYAERFLPEILARFTRSNPLVELEIACERSLNLAEHIEKGRLDVALVSNCELITGGEIVRREPLHFVTSTAHDVHTKAVLPLALGRNDCAWRQQGCEALDAIGRQYRVLFSSWSAQIVTSAVLSGLAVSVLPECALRPGMRVLSEYEGFPRLRDTEIAVLKARNVDNPVVDALIDHIRESLQNLAPPAVQPAPSGIPETRVVRAPQLTAAW
ncbi:LysR family transcriptional regulator [Mangrovibrevibacter kandeliae]|uniref:LysR family transcriptional regulator n=1 Tax=Mangrovibrevibacter kandeliae TaxID=2968473 RepID=UPI002118FAEE|nr:MULTISPECIES: LysR family transcriptional regulator [unclassified Aurantimonas]MCQ8780788.1 LysR substrate-binding domain-containing protein [Aurantimonas sp. CSK15Z-1]MCW4113569.1 LysR substrate-binding domain-containing protein [Aurantimonas sp. MSK8Z-1]